MIEHHTSQNAILKQKMMAHNESGYYQTTSYSSLYYIYHFEHPRDRVREGQVMALDKSSLHCYQPPNRRITVMQ